MKTNKRKTLRSTSCDVYVHEPNHMLQICSSKGKLLTLMAHDDLKIQCGYQLMAPSAWTTARASRASISVSALPGEEQSSRNISCCVQCLFDFWSSEVVPFSRDTKIWLWVCHELEGWVPDTLGLRLEPVTYFLFLKVLCVWQKVQIVGGGWVTRIALIANNLLTYQVICFP